MDHHHHHNHCLIWGQLNVFYSKKPTSQDQECYLTNTSIYPTFNWLKTEREQMERWVYRSCGEWPCAWGVGAGRGRLWPRGQRAWPSWSGGACPGCEPSSSLRCCAASGIACIHSCKQTNNQSDRLQDWRVERERYVYVNVIVMGGMNKLPSKMIAHEIGIFGEIDGLEREPSKPLSPVDGFILGRGCASAPRLRSPVSIHLKSLLSLSNPSFQQRKRQIITLSSPFSLTLSD